jgi:hypothetical protein
MRRSGGFSLRAVFSGLLITLGGPVLVGALLGGVSGFGYAQKGYTPHQIQILLRQDLFSEPALMALLAIGGLFLVLGSFVGANLAGRAELLHAGVVGTVYWLLNLPFVWEYLGVPLNQGFPEWYMTVNLLLIMPIAFLGGALSVGTSEESATSQQTLEKWPLAGLRKSENQQPR